MSSHKEVESRTCLTYELVTQEEISRVICEDGVINYITSISNATRKSPAIILVVPQEAPSACFVCKDHSRHEWKDFVTLEMYWI